MYLHLIDEAVEAGLHVPPLPPLAQQEEPDQVPEPVDVQPVAALPALQIIIPAPLVTQLLAVV